MNLCQMTEKRMFTFNGSIKKYYTRKKYNYCNKFRAKFALQPDYEYLVELLLESAVDNVTIFYQTLAMDLAFRNRFTIANHICTLV